jgi:hypothetical protein
MIAARDFPFRHRPDPPRMRDARDDGLRAMVGLIDRPDLTRAELCLAAWLGLAELQRRTVPGSFLSRVLADWQVLVEKSVDTLPAAWIAETSRSLVDANVVEHVAGHLWERWCLDQLSN